MIRLSRSAGAATLEIDAKTKQAGTRLVLVLDADARVKWTIRAVGSAVDPLLQHSVVVSLSNADRPTV